MEYDTDNNSVVIDRSLVVQEGGDPPIPVNDALDNMVLTFTISGDSNWYAQDETFMEGLSALISNIIDHNESTSVSTDVKGPGVVQFHWKGSNTISPCPLHPIICCC